MTNKAPKDMPTRTSLDATRSNYYWKENGDYLQHYKGGWHRLIVANYISKTDLTLNLTLTTVLHIFTSNDASPYNGQDTLSHRPADKQIYNLRKRKWWQRLHMTETEELPRLCCKKGSWTSQKRTGMKDEKKHIEITHVMPSIRSTPMPSPSQKLDWKRREKR